MSAAPSGPLAGLRVIEFASIGPGPHCAMLLSDMGADVLRVDRDGGNGWPNPVADRGRAAKVIDIRTEEGRDFCLDAADHADVLIEGYRPGVMERLGLGPDVLSARNPRLIYGRMTGWGQDGPLASTAGHDINYIGLTGALAAIGKPGEPATVPLNLVGDFGGGSMFLAFGILAALWERERSGEGQVIDAAIIDGVGSLMTMFAGLLPTGRISLARDENILGGAAPYYRSYMCGDGREISVGAIEPPFFAELLTRLGLEEHIPDQNRRERWGDLTRSLEQAFLAESRAHWIALFAGGDACVAPVLTFDDLPSHPHLQARQSYEVRDGVTHAAVAPRFSRTRGAIQPAGDGDALLAAWKASPPRSTA
jgi:alpha-methylacyl-CoA racemase